MAQIVPPEKTAAFRRTEELAKAIRRANLSLQEFSQIEKELRQIAGYLQSFSDQIEQNPESKKEISKAFHDNEIFGLFGQLQAGINQLKKTMLDLEEPLLKQGVFLSHHRQHRRYAFSSAEQIIAFLNETSQIYSISRFEFKPEFSGLTNFKPLLTKLQIKETNGTNFSIAPNQLGELFEYLSQPQTGKNFRLESPTLKISCKLLRELKIETDNPTIRRLDLLANTQNAKILDD
ncbi:MAG: hypothetical protein V1777_01855 [Candidatus Micrarchaeota archaeon]